MILALRAFLVAALVWIAGATARADSRSPWSLTANDEDLDVSLVTFGEGAEIHQYFGHNALLVEDRVRRIGALYNFGMFGFGPDMLPKYLQGQLEFWVAATPVEHTYRNYIAENRSIHVSELNLSPQKRRYLAERLAWYAEPEHRYYRYHHYNNNCSTKVRDLIDETIGGQLSRTYATPGHFTYRGDTRRYTQQDPIIHMLLLLWMNDSMERPIRRYDEAFLPGELEHLVDGMTYVDEHGQKQPLVRTRYTVFEARRAPVPAQPSAAWPGLLAVGIAFGGIALALSRWLRTGSRLARALLGLHHMVMGLAIGVPGLILFLFLFTQWDVTHYNENLFIANPLTFALLPLGFWMAFGSRRAQRWAGNLAIALGAMTLLAIVLKVLPAFDQDTHLPLALIAPINFGSALAHLALRRQPEHAAAPAPVEAASA
jgi:hypothetical protein